ncbi:nickel pincer cofactor biosynthesis protein LarB [Chamaesiphon sp. VAR_48_metabat_135_sub]|uniref:nickel pincer cofactor biosynthesis protein LarB n=1 Tax=Chamaesiphon sp. VAR_48_metabat_135_sub TaxID=2964699 RepID=UPI00286B41AF|nr:nickel pincer cofactor biosynthesis protein LarB [Chamaesiphon sp. VAR_48_metabat_135_sub]
MSESLQAILTAVAAGEITPDRALLKLQSQGYESIDEFAKIDRSRQQRTGFPEVIWGLGKTPAQIASIIQVMRQQQSVVMATRITPAVYAELHQQIPDLVYYQMAQICALTPLQPTPIHLGRITILTAGTADLPVAEEAACTATLCGFEVEKLWDVGVAGIHRLLSNHHVIDNADVLIVVAGMEGALASVVAGLADCPVIAVPTSIGYGASFGGIAPLLTMLNSCAAGVGVVNIDNGFGAAILACQILRTATKITTRSNS